MKLKILEHVWEEGYFICEDESENIRRVDLSASGDFNGYTWDRLKGKIIEVDDIYPFIEIATNPRVIE